LLCFANSLWQDCPDTSRSTGGYHIVLQGGIVNSAMTFPVLVALCSAKAEYNSASAATVAAQALSMLIQDIRNADPIACCWDLLICCQGFPLRHWGLFGYWWGLGAPLPQQAHDIGVGVQDGNKSFHEIDTK
jgi:hypothetical protein